MEQIITGCKDCPLNSNDRLYGDFCRHPAAIDQNGNDAALPTDSENGYETITPDWCPLNSKQNL